MAFIPFYTALILYAVLSSPTPDIIGLSEYAIALLFIMSIGVAGGWNILTRHDYSATLSCHRFFLLYMISVPLGIGILSAYPITDIARDIIPIILLVLPLWAYNRNLPYFADILLIMGGVFAFRYILPLLSEGMQGYTPLLYLANSPLIPFAAIYGFHRFVTSSSYFYSYRIAALIISLLCFMAMALMLQRAPLGLSVLACLGLITLLGAYRPLAAMLLLSGLGFIMVPFTPLLETLIDTLTGKTLSVGWNNRFAEWDAVMNDTSLFGTGWGAQWQSPAVADIWVRYTHNFISYFWLKAGVIGGFMAIAFMVIWGTRAIRLIRCNPAMGLAITVPLLIHFTLYAGFKSLDFALILTLLSLQYNSNRNRYAVPDKIDSYHQSCLPPDLRRDGADGVRSCPASTQKRA